MMKSNILLIILFLSVHLIAQEDHLMKLLPSAGEMQGYELKNEPEYYQGDDLFFLINGGADIYLEYGFKDVVSASYEKEAGVGFKAEVYQMLNDSAAYGIFSFNRNDREIYHDVGDESIREDDFVIFIKDRFYVVITSRSNQDGQKINLLKIAKLLEAKIKGSGSVPHLVSEYDSIAPNAIYIRGNLALNNIYLFDYTNVFQFTEGIYFKKQGISTFIFQYPTSEASEKIFETIKSRFQSSTRFHDFKEKDTGFEMLDKKEQLLSFISNSNRIYIFIGNDSADIAKKVVPFLQ